MSIESRKVFISWSKAPTDHVASELARFLKHMFDNVRPFVSKDNVAFGSLSIGEIHRQLAGTSFGILVVTRANQFEPWLNFEAGSLAKTIPEDADARVVPLLIDHESTAQLAGPIANLQAVLADKDGIRRMLLEMADTLGVDAAVFESRWGTGWSRFSGVLDEARKALAEGPVAPDRSPEDMLEEIVTLLRSRAVPPTNRTPSPVFSETDEHAAVDFVFQQGDKLGVHVASVRLPQDENDAAELEVNLYRSADLDPAQVAAFRRRLESRFPQFRVRIIIS